MDNDIISLEKTDAGKIQKARENVRLALEASLDWRKEAKEDYNFVQGKQWDEKDIEIMKQQKRPCITINRCRPMINQVSGYFGKNLSEATFLPKSKEDNEVCRIAKGVTKYVYDKANFKRAKKKVIKDRLICGVGYYWVWYDFDYDAMDGTIRIDRRSPFEVFVDPEAKLEDLSDAAFCGVYSWESPEELKLVYPEVAEEIGGLEHGYDAEEVVVDAVGGEPLWYSKQLKKLRVCQYWYREKEFRNVYTMNGEQMEEADVPPEMMAMVKLGLPGIKKHRVPSWKYYYMTFCDNVLLEQNESPYKHKRYPLVPEYAYYTGEKDENDTTLEPAGIIRDLKPVQREVNKQRSQRMHIVNTQANGFWLVFGTSTPEFDAQLKNSGTTPGARFNVPPGVTDVRYITSPGVSVSNVEMEKTSGEDFYTISGVNPESMGSTDSPASMSGVAIDRRQGAAFTQISDLAEESNYSEQLIIDRLWGGKGRQGLIQQYFTEQQVMRIIGDDEEQSFVQIASGLPQAKVEKQVVDPRTGQPMLDQQGNPIKEMLFDLSKFEFDIKVEPTQMTPTMMQATLFQLIDAAKNGIPIPPEMLVEYMPMTNKAEIKKVMKQNAENQKPEPPKTALSINFKDLPIEAKAAILAENGIQVNPQSIADQQDIAMRPQLMQKGM